MKKISTLSFILSFFFISIIITTHASTSFTYTTHNGILYKTTSCWDKASNTYTSHREVHIPLQDGMVLIDTTVTESNNERFVIKKLPMGYIHQLDPAYIKKNGHQFSLFHNPFFSTHEVKSTTQKKSPIPTTHRAIVAKVLKEIRKS